MDKKITYFLQLTEKNESTIHIKGKWVLSEAAPIKLLIQNLDKKNIKKVILNFQDLKELDSAGSWLIKAIEKFYKKDNINVTYTNLLEKFQNLFTRIHHLDDISILLHQEAPFIEKTLISIGEKTIIAWKDGLDLLGFFGEVLTISIRSILRPLKFRWTSLFYHIRIMGFDAVPIIGLLTFLVGIVLAYQGATQLQRFGADIYTVNLVGIATLRELGILLSAVIIAGRTGSAITAQIGTMAVNEEIDALKTMGIHPLEILVIPRIFALMIAFPLLTFFGNIMA
ncbi:MAG: ABC transporter permease, partial [Alphaproteobacteria bacterium]|nr:ABC transporter permease [Alphaproteobacteria bacterium]